MGSQLHVVAAHQSKASQARNNLLLTYLLGRSSGGTNYLRKFFPIAFRRKAFIGKTARVPNARSSLGFEIMGAAPGRDQEAVDDAIDALPELNADNTTMDYEQWLGDPENVPADAEGWDRPLVDIGTDTPTHAGIMNTCLNLGYRDYTMDKPPFDTLAEFNQVNAEVERLGATVYISKNHRHFAPLDEGKHRIAMCDPSALKWIKGGFRQGWCATKINADEPGGKQQAWRLGLHGPSMDIETHWIDLVTNTAGSEVDEVTSGKFSRDGAHGQASYDTGSSEFVLANGVTGSGVTTNANPAFINDLFLAFCLHEKGQDWTYLWKMEVCGGNLLLRKKGQDVSIEDPLTTGGWEALHRGVHFCDEVNAVYDWQPPGHGYDWTNAWLQWWIGVHGAQALKYGILPADMLHAAGKAPVASLADGGRAMRYVYCHDHAAASGGSFKMADVTEEFKMEAPK